MGIGPLLSDIPGRNATKLVPFKDLTWTHNSVSVVLVGVGVGGGEVHPGDRSRPNWVPSAGSVGRWRLERDPESTRQDMDHARGPHQDSLVTHRPAVLFLTRPTMLEAITTEGSKEL